MSNDNQKVRITQKKSLTPLRRGGLMCKINNKDQRLLAMFEFMKRNFNPDMYNFNPNNVAAWLGGSLCIYNDQDKRARFRAYIVDEGAESFAATLDSLGMSSASRVADDIRKGLYLYRNPKPNKAVDEAVELEI